MLGMLPAQQRLDAEHGAAPHVHLGLEIQAQLVVVQRFLYAADGENTRLGAPAVLGVEEQVAIAAGLLGAVHRVVGMAQQGVGVGLVDRIDRRADARGDDHRPGTDTERVGLRHVAHHALDGVPAFLECGGAQQQHELVATEPRHRVRPHRGAAQRAAQALAELDEQAVARGVAEAVVDRLEVVEIEIAHGEQTAFALAGGHRVGQHLRHARAVRQPRQLVEMGLALQALALQPLLGDVGDHQHVVAHRIVGAEHAGDRDLQRARVAVAAALHYFAAPSAHRTQAGPHRRLLLVRCRAGGGRLQQRRDRAEQFLARGAGDLRIGRVEYLEPLRLAWGVGVF